MGFRHLREHKFRHNFQDCLNPPCLCSNEIENSTHYLIHCPTYRNERLTLLNKIKSINCSILESSDAAVRKFLLFDDNTLSSSSNTFILNSTIEYIISNQRFEGSIEKHYLHFISFHTLLFLKRLSFLFCFIFFSGLLIFSLD